MAVLPTKSRQLSPHLRRSFADSFPVALDSGKFAAEGRVAKAPLKPARVMDNRTSDGREREPR